MIAQFPETIRSCCMKGLAMLFGCALFSIALALLIFPAYKHIYAGWVPVFIGLAIVLLTPTLYAKLQSNFALRGGIRILPVLIILFASLLQVVLLLSFRPQPVADGLIVIEQAKAFASSGNMPPLTYYPPLQTWWYAAFFKLFGFSVLTAQCSNILLYIALMVFAYRFVRESWNQERAILTLLGIACYPSLQLYVLTTPYYFYTYLLLVTSFSLCLVRSLRHSLYSALGGVLAALAALAKAVMLVAPGICLVFQFIEPNQSWPKRIKSFVLFSVVFLITLAPWSIRNYRVFQAFVPVCTSGGLVFYSANNPDSNGLYSPIPDHSEKGFSAPEFLRYSQECHGKGMAFIRNQPTQFIKLSLKKFLHTWGTETTFTELINYRGATVPRLEMLMNLLIQIGWSSLVFFCIRQYLYQRETTGLNLSSVELILALLLISQIVIYMVFEGGARHHLAIVPLLIIYAALPAKQIKHDDVAKA